MKKAARLLQVLIVVIIISAMLSILWANNKNASEEWVLPPGTKFIVHRGLSSEYFENSEQAFLAAASSDFFFGIETDIWLTSDGVWVCAHDDNPFEDSSVKITQSSYEEIRALPLKTESFQEEIFICDFERYLDICVEHNKIPVIELKYTPSEQELEQLIEFIKSKTDIRKTIFVSFHLKNIDNLKAIDSMFHCQMLVNNSFTSALYISSNYDVGLRHNIVNADIVQEVKQKGLLLNVWTVNDSAKAKEFMEWGVDFITTDYILDV